MDVTTTALPATARDGLRIGEDGVARCWWAGTDLLYQRYHDEEWGVPCHDDRELFERLMLEGFQAGLAWITILRKREHFFRAFDGWEAERIAAYGPEDAARLLADPGIVRNRLKVEAAIKNARAFLRLREETGSFDRYLWGFVGGEPLRRIEPPRWDDLPSRSPESDALSKDLKRRGFSFVGTTIVYAFMQSVGMVDDHVDGCFRAASPPDSP
jgi:DNA-3-methyladenine glycosylase I